MPAPDGENRYDISGEQLDSTEPLKAHLFILSFNRYLHIAHNGPGTIPDPGITNASIPEFP